MRTSRIQSIVFAVVLVAIGLILYANALNSPFIYDDLPAIVDNGDLRQLWPPDWLLPSASSHASVNSRPFVSFSLALNYAWSGIDPWSYHAVNLALHITNALLLFAVVRRTLM